MEQLNPSDLKAILHFKRANVYYLQYCRVMQLRNACLIAAITQEVHCQIGSLEKDNTVGACITHIH